jgi:hypothetical protein
MSNLSPPAKGAEEERAILLRPQPTDAQTLTVAALLLKAFLIDKC